MNSPSLHDFARDHAEGMKHDIEGMVADSPTTYDTNFDLWFDDDNDEIWIDFGDMSSPVRCYTDSAGKHQSNPEMRIPDSVKNPIYP